MGTAARGTRGLFERMAAWPIGGRAVIYALVHLALTHISLSLVIQPEGIAVLWPPSGYVAGLLILHERRHWPVLLLAIVPGDLLVNLLAGRSVWVAAGFLTANFVEDILIASTFLLFSHGAASLDRVSHLLGLLVAMLFGSAVSATLAASVMVWGLGTADYGSVWLSWSAAAFTGCLVVAPLLIAWCSRPYGSWNWRKEAPEFLALLIATALVTLLVFAKPTTTGNDLLLGLYLPFPLLIWAGLRLHPRASTLVTLLLAVVATALTVAGRGPMGAIEGTVGTRILWLQVYMACAILTSLLVTSVMLERGQAVWRSNRFMDAIEQSADAVILADASGVIEYINKAARSMFAELQVGQTLWTDALELPEAHKRERRRAVEGRLSFSADFSIHEDGHEKVELHESIAPVLDTHGDVSHFIARIGDVTRRKQLESQLIQSQKLEAVGQLAGGVAHDFNNLLTVILGSAQVIRLNLQAAEAQYEQVESDILEPLGDIELGAERAALLTGQLLTFSRRQPLQPRVLDVNASLLAIESMLRRLLPGDVRLSLELSDAPAHVLADPSNLERLFVNLAVNARDAMLSGGVLSITTKVGFAPASEAPVKGKADERVFIEVTDTGHGIPPELIPQIFNPFFTTKSDRGGTGLGLATVFGIVSQSGGEMDVRSTVDLGTTFCISLPRAKRLATQSSTEQTERPKGGAETLLLCDDDEGVRKTTERFLASAGYEVLSASSGKDALGLLKQRESPVDLLITDVIMPGMSGRQLADAVGDLAPGTKTLFISGYPADVISERGTLQPGVELLHKPFTGPKLLARVRDLLDA